LWGIFADRPRDLILSATAVVVYYGWMNSKAKAEGRKCNGYLCHEAERAAACMTSCLPHTLVGVRAELRAWEVEGWACTIERRWPKVVSEKAMCAMKQERPQLV